MGQGRFFKGLIAKIERRLFHSQYPSMVVAGRTNPILEIQMSILRMRYAAMGDSADLWKSLALPTGIEPVFSP
jgi:hypothetical protein